ncbi:Rpn family recombination-promoting nuclease/putative transposase [Haliangium sp.]|uniref:Rpn family recombination-promoting nuclease/putative transposase n=1 Tax=Haliangium sp. TaxID=2663208 RepID=UPI003D0D76C4
MTVPTPHDRLFRFTFGQPTLAAELLAYTLPAPLCDRVAFDTLAKKQRDFVDPLLRERASDLVYGLGLRGSGQPLAVVLEHQSAGDPLMAWRVQRYSGEVTAEYIRRRPGTHKLPMTLAVVIYHGDRPWRDPTELAELYLAPDELVAALGAHLPRYRFVLDDLAATTDDALRARPMSATAIMTLWALKHTRHEPDIIEALRGVLDLLGAATAADGGRDVIVAVMEYLLSVGSASRESLAAFLREEALPETYEALMTAGELLRQEGRKEGRKEGQQELLLALLTARYGELPGAVVARVRAADVDALTTWGKRVLFAETLEDVFAAAA